jgi:hypothetical protein
MRQEERRVPRPSQKPCKQRGFCYPPRIYTGVSPEYHRVLSVGTPGGPSSWEAAGRMGNAARTRQGPSPKCCQCRGLRDPDGRTTGILPCQCGGRRPVARPLSMSAGGRASARARTSPGVRQATVNSQYWSAKKRACRGSDFPLTAATSSGGVPQIGLASR